MTTPPCTQDKVFGWILIEHPIKLNPEHALANRYRYKYPDTDTDTATTYVRNYKWLWVFFGLWVIEDCKIHVPTTIVYTEDMESG